MKPLSTHQATATPNRRPGTKPVSARARQEAANPHRTQGHLAARSEHGNHHTANYHADTCQAFHQRHLRRPSVEMQLDKQREQRKGRHDHQHHGAKQPV